MFQSTGSLTQQITFRILNKFNFIESQGTCFNLIAICQFSKSYATPSSAHARYFASHKSPNLGLQVKNNIPQNHIYYIILMKHKTKKQMTFLDLGVSQD